MRAKECIASSDHGRCVLSALLPGDCICAAAVHDNGTRTAAALEDVAGDDDGCSTESFVGRDEVDKTTARSRGGGAPGRIFLTPVCTPVSR